MENFIPYLILGILLMVLIVHLLERYAMVITFGLIITLLLYIYFPPKKVSQLPQEQKPTIPDVTKKANHEKQESDTLINVAPSDLPEDKNHLKTDKATNRTLPQHSYQQVVTKDQVFIQQDVKLTDCTVDENLHGSFVLIESVFKDESTAIRRVMKLQNAGFLDAFYLYLPCYKTRFDDQRKLFAVVHNSFDNLTELKVSQKAYVELAEHNNFRLVFKDKVVKIEKKVNLSRSP